MSHDGFTLHDLYTCDASNNTQAWPFGPSSGGSTTNHAWDHGGDPVAQRQATRTGLALELLSAGVPMIAGGDELAHGIQCNNNPYNLDSTATWLDYSTQTDPLWTFTQRLFAFRTAHPALRRATWTGGPQWIDAAGQPATSTYMNDATQPILGWLLGGTSDPIYAAYNRGIAQVTITLPDAGGALAWYRVANTASFLEAQSNFVAAGTETAVTSPQYALDARALVLFVTH